MNALFYKEWIKTRIYLILILFIQLATSLYCVLKLRYVWGQNDAEQIWGAWLFKAYSFYTPYQYLPLFAGVLLACAQYLPEVRERRLRLVLHLPLEEQWGIFTHVLFGLLSLAVLGVIAAIPLLAASLWRFPVEHTMGLLLTLSPWVFAGFCAYSLVSAILIETRWGMRILLGLIAVGALRLFYMELSIGSYGRILLPLGLGTLALSILPLLSAERFRRNV